MKTASLILAAMILFFSSHNAVPASGTHEPGQAISKVSKPNCNQEPPPPGCPGGDPPPTPPPAPLPPPPAGPQPIPNGIARTRGCRTGGIEDINTILPEWVSVEASDAPRVIEGTVRESHTATNDNPAFHVSHDWNADVFLDTGYNNLNSDANKIEEGERRMEIEWETAFFPPSFWPIPGDRTWMLGRWIFDCGHPPYQSEIHPPKAVAFTHAEPVIFPGDPRPSRSNLTRIYIHGRGGYYKAPITGRNYEFDVPLPPRPGPLSSLRTSVLSLPFGGPSPILALVPNGNPPRLHVTYPLASISDPSNMRRFGAVIASAWQSIAINRNEPGYRLLRVSFDSIKVNNDHDGTFSGSGEWRLWVRAGSQWLEITGLSDVDGGDTVAINNSIDLIVPDDGAFGIQTSGWEDDCDWSFRSKDSDINLRKVSIGDLNCEINGYDNIGILERGYNASNSFGIGSHNEASARNGDADTQGDFNLRYRVEMLKRFEPGGVVVSPASPPVVAPTR